LLNCRGKHKDPAGRGQGNLRGRDVSAQTLAKRRAPGSKVISSAPNYDERVGNAFESEISAKLEQVAPKAAISYIAAGKLAEAHTAIGAAGSSSDDNVKAVRQKLESEAGKIYSEALKEMDSSPDSAREKFKQILGIVDSKSPWYQKANKQLKGAYSTAR